MANKKNPFNKTLASNKSYFQDPCMGNSLESDSSLIACRDAEISYGTSSNKPTAGDWHQTAMVDGIGQDEGYRVRKYRVNT